MFVPAGSDMIVSLHYTATGLAVVDRSRIGFTVDEDAAARRSSCRRTARRVRTRRWRGSRRTRHWRFRPLPANHPGPMAEIDFLKDVELVWFRPHAHVRGKTVRYTLVHPDGREETVLYVPRYNFNWQLTYGRRSRSRRASKMRVQFTYDNSTANKYNPDPEQVGLLWRPELGGDGHAEHGLPRRSERDDEDVIRSADRASSD